MVGDDAVVTTIGVRPVVVMSAYPSDREAESAVAAGCTGFLPKPFTQAELHKMLNTCLVNLESRE